MMHAHNKYVVIDTDVPQETSRTQPATMMRGLALIIGVVMCAVLAADAARISAQKPTPCVAVAPCSVTPSHVAFECLTDIWVLQRS